MDETTKPGARTNSTRLRRLLRLPSFGVALAITLATLLAFAVWMVVDASFPVTLSIARIDLGLQEFPKGQLTREHRWDNVGSRLCLFASLAAVGILATLIVFYRTLFGSQKNRTLRAMFVAVALVGLWLALGLFHERLEMAGYQWRLTRTLERLKEDAAILLAEWPTTGGTLPFSGAYFVEADNPHLLKIRPDNWYTMKEQIGPLVSRTGDGGLMFDYIDHKIEYHRNGGQPNSYTLAQRSNGKEVFRGHWVLQRYTELEPNWFHATYIRDRTPRADKPTEKETLINADSNR